MYNKKSDSASYAAPNYSLKGELRIERLQQRASIAMLAIALISAVVLSLPDSVVQSVNARGLSNSKSSLSSKKIIIDAGHGGFDPGAIGIDSIQEAPLNLAVSKALEKELKSRGAVVELTRPNSEALADEKYADMKVRSKLYEESGADAGISIHMNKFSQSNVSGPMVFYYPGSESGRLMAQAVQDTLDEQLERPKAREAKPENYFILRESKTISILVECGFISNPNDVWLLQSESHQNKLAKAIADGLENYFELPQSPALSPNPDLETENSPENRAAFEAINCKD